MIRIPSLALLALLGIVESLPAQYFLIKLDVSKIDFTNVTDGANNGPSEWLCASFDFMKSPDAPPGKQWVYKGLGKDSIILRKHKWGTNAIFTPGAAVQIKTPDEVSIPTPKSEFEKKKKNDLFQRKDKDELLKEARWALMHGLPKEFEEIMDALNKADPGNATYASFAKIRSALNQSANKSAPLPEFLKKGVVLNADYVGEYLKEVIKKGLKLSNRDGHFRVYYRNDLQEFTENDSASVKRRLKRMEQTMSNFFYWFAFQEFMKDEMKPKVPEYKLAVLLEPPDKFDERLKEWGGPAQGEPCGFTLRSENFVVLSSRPKAKAYRDLVENMQNLLTSYPRVDDLIAGAVIQNGGKAKPLWTLPAMKGNLNKLYLVQTLALMQRAAEDDMEATTISRECTRQLLGATGLLASKVVAPEWLQSGLLTFFEIPPNSLYPNFGQLRDPYLRRFKSIKERDKNIKDVDILLNLIDDRYFRAAAADFERSERLRKNNGPKSQRDLLKAASKESLDMGEAASWAFVYYLDITGNMPQLFEYARLLDDLPRHTALNAQTLEACFAKAFQMESPADPRQIDFTKLEKFAREWVEEMNRQPEGEMRAVEAFLNDGR